MKIQILAYALLIGFLSQNSYAHINSNSALTENKFSIPNHITIDNIVIEKQKHLMSVFHNNQRLRTYRIALGFSPEGHKTQQGDGKTPEGTYYIVGKNTNSLFHLSLKLSYPSIADQKNAAKMGVDPGNNIMIHGLASHLKPKGKWHAMKDWTLGCIAVTNDEIEEIFHFADIGTKVEIIP